MIEIHIVAGLLSLLSGGVAIIAQILTPNRVNVVAAILTAYLVCTSLLTVTRKVEDVRWLTAAFALWTATTSFFIGQAKVFPDPCVRPICS